MNQDEFILGIIFSSSEFDTLFIKSSLVSFQYTLLHCMKINIQRNNFLQDKMIYVQSQTDHHKRNLVNVFVENDKKKEYLFWKYLIVFELSKILFIIRISTIGDISFLANIIPTMSVIKNICFVIHLITIRTICFEPLSFTLQNKTFSMTSNLSIVIIDCSSFYNFWIFMFEKNDLITFLKLMKLKIKSLVSKKVFNLKKQKQNIQLISFYQELNIYKERTLKQGIYKKRNFKNIFFQKKLNRLINRIRSYLKDFFKKFNLTIQINESIKLNKKLNEAYIGLNVISMIIKKRLKKLNYIEHQMKINLQIMYENLQFHDNNANNIKFNFNYLLSSIKQFIKINNVLKSQILHFLENYTNKKSIFNKKLFFQEKEILTINQLTYNLKNLLSSFIKN